MSQNTAPISDIISSLLPEEEQQYRAFRAYLSSLGLSSEEEGACSRLVARCLAARRAPPLQWHALERVPSIPLRADLPTPERAEAQSLLQKLAVLKLNGGLGTTMGCTGPKSVIQVRNGKSFLDLVVDQIKELNGTHGCSVPLVLMNSFNTDHDTSVVLQKYHDDNIDIRTFQQFTYVYLYLRYRDCACVALISMQSKFPRLFKDTLQPMPNGANSNLKCWYPPGHGNVYDALQNSGVLDRLLAEGKEYLFVSNIDNLGATVDMAILAHMAKTGTEFVMEVTNKTLADVKGGTLVKYEGRTKLLEVAQVPKEHIGDFKSIEKFDVFNTNNIWLDLRAVKRALENGHMDLDVIENVKVVDGKEVLQLETAIGAAISCFSNALGINVPRSRFLPVKSTSDLLIVQSDVYEESHGTLAMRSERGGKPNPRVELGSEFKKVGDYLERFGSCPSLLQLDQLRVSGDVWFGENVTLVGDVDVVAPEGKRINVPSGATLNSVVVGADSSA